jgi:hypothetical protein
MKKLLVTLALAAAPSLAGADDAALYTHCARNWSAQTVGETFLQLAVEDGFPVVAPTGQRSGTKAYQLGYNYFRFLDPHRNTSSAVLCAIFVQRGPGFFAEW